jgi:hypothetical protein
MHQPLAFGRPSRPVAACVGLTGAWINDAARARSSRFPGPTWRKAFKAHPRLRGGRPVPPSTGRSGRTVLPRTLAAGRPIVANGSCRGRPGARDHTSRIGGTSSSCTTVLPCRSRSTSAREHGDALCQPVTVVTAAVTKARSAPPECRMEAGLVTARLERHALRSAMAAKPAVGFD